MDQPLAMESADQSNKCSWSQELFPHGGGGGTEPGHYYPAPEKDPEEGQGRYTAQGAEGRLQEAESMSPSLEPQALI